MELRNNLRQRLEDDSRGGIGWALLIAALAVSFTLDARAKDLRLELAAGVAQHRLAPEGSWWYDGFEKQIDLKATGFSIGALWTPWKLGSYRLGLRAGYADLGTVRAENAFPIFEDGTAHDARVNPNCDRATLSGCTGKFTGAGTVKGIYAGVAGERDFGRLTIGAEGGLFYYRSQWVAINLRGVDAGGEFWPAGWNQIRWDNVRGYHGTLYAGLNLRWREFFVSWRQYANVHAAQTDKGKDFIGLTSGPLRSVMAGVSLPF